MCNIVMYAFFGQFGWWFCWLVIWLFGLLGSCHLVVWWVGWLVFSMQICFGVNGEIVY